MSNHSIFKGKNLNKVFHQGLNKICNFDKLEQEECISLAFVMPIEMLLPIVLFMIKWVEAIEVKLEKEEKYSDIYSDILCYRMFTYDEFRWVVETSFSEEKLDRVPVYGFLYLDDAIAVEEFKIKYGDSEENMRTRYLRALADISEIEFPELYQFLCKDKITLRYPMSAFQKHTYCLAQSSSGKSELDKHLFHELVRHPSLKSVIHLEPHMDLSVEILQLRAIWKKGVQSVVYLDPDITFTSNMLTGRNHDFDFVFSLNPFDNEDIDEKSINYLVEHLSSAFFEIIKSEETFQMHALIEACVETLIRKPNCDILDLKRFMDDNQNEDLVLYGQNYLSGERQELMKHRFSSDPKIQQTKSSIYYRLQSILGKRELVQCLTGRRTVDLQKYMNQGSTIVCNFSKSKLGPEGAPILGKLFMALFSGYATLRQNMKKSERMPTYFFVDEFQNYINPGSTEEMFAEQRKYSTYFYVSNQQIGQSMSPEAQRIVVGNTGVKLMGDNEHDSFSTLSKEFKKLPEDAAFKLPRYSFWFYDKYNKSLGSLLLRSPKYLVEKSSTYYLTRDETMNVLDFLMNKSGLYRKSANVLKSNVALKEVLKEEVILEHSFTS